MERREHVFMVRMWSEPTSSPARPAWRGSVRHVASGDVRFVTTPSDIAEFVGTRLAAATPSGEAHAVDTRDD